MLAVVALLPTCLLLQAARYDVSVRGETRMRPWAASLALQPAGRLAVTGPVGTASVNYSARLLWQEPYLGWTTNVLHTGAANVGLPIGRHFRLFAFQTAAYGIADFSTFGTPLIPGAAQLQVPGQRPVPPPVQPLPSAGQALFAQSDTTAGFDWDWPWETGITVTGGYTVYGGLNADSRRAVPFYYGPRASGRLRKRIDFRNNAGVGLELNRTTFTTGVFAEYAELTGYWDHRLSNDYAFTLSGGVLDLNWRLGTTLPLQEFLLPVGRASVRHFELHGPHLLEAEWVADVGPFIDRFAGLIYTRAEGVLQLTWTYSGYAVIEARAGVAQALNGPLEGDVSAVGEALATYDVDRNWQFEASVQSGVATTPRSTGAFPYFVLSFSVILREGGPL